MWQYLSGLGLGFVLPLLLGLIWIWRNELHSGFWWGLSTGILALVLGVIALTLAVVWGMKT